MNCVPSCTAVFCGKVGLGERFWVLCKNQGQHLVLEMHELCSKLHSSFILWQGEVVPEGQSPGLSKEKAVEGPLVEIFSCVVVAVGL